MPGGRDAMVRGVGIDSVDIEEMARLVADERGVATAVVLAQ